MDKSGPRILVISKPAIGDALLTTPLIHSIRMKEPNATIDLLVQGGQESVVEGNTDIDNVFTIDARPSASALFDMARKWWRKYDIAIGNAVDDRMHIYLFLFAKKRVSVLTASSRAWKRWITYASYVEDETGTHVLLRNNKLGSLLGFDSCYTVYPPRIELDQQRNSVLDHIKDSGQRYAVLHLDARLPYKRWTDSGWIAVASDFADRGIKTYLTGGGGPDETKYLDALSEKMPGGAVVLSGLLRFADVTELISGACIYVGVDTVNSHIAAALGIPTLALFGPENPLRWGPWPAGLETDDSPWKNVGSQRLRNVSIIQSESGCGECVSGACRLRRENKDGCPLMTGITAEQVVQEISIRLD